MELSAEDRAVLAHVVIDPDAWVAHAAKTFGEEKAQVALAEKVARWQPDYLSAVAAEGEDYKTRAERDALANP